MLGIAILDLISLVGLSLIYLARGLAEDLSPGICSDSKGEAPDLGRRPCPVGFQLGGVWGVIQGVR